jgi:hypothetical protein
MTAISPREKNTTLSFNGKTGELYIILLKILMSDLSSRSRYLLPAFSK